MNPELQAQVDAVPALTDVIALRETVWTNPGVRPFAQAEAGLPVTRADVDEAADRLDRFAPFLAQVFPETAERGGIIESPLREIPAMRDALLAGDSDGTTDDAAGGTPWGRVGDGLPVARLLLKMDSHLAVAGSVKARGGIHEVLAHAEELALDAGLLTTADDYRRLAEPDARALFAAHTVQVGSTGNLGMSIGIASAAVGFRVVVHMSADAKRWKKDLLRSKGVEVHEYEGDYGRAVARGRALSDADPTSYFVDDENSRRLFCGYAVAARRLRAQLDELGVTVDAAHPLVVHLPCGVGGAPGGIAYGLKTEFGDAARAVFVEPTHAPCMLTGMATGLHDAVAVTDLGIDGVTQADGLAVGRPSAFVGRVMEPLVDAVVTVDDSRLVPWLRALDATEGVRVEPSACAAFAGPLAAATSAPLRDHLTARLPDAAWDDAVHVAWATGGSLVPDDVMRDYLGR